MNENGFFLITGTGANIDIKCGFVPAKVEVMNITSTGLEKLEWYRGMPDASGIKTTSAPARTKITTLGITPLGDDVADTVEQGFRIGADTDINVAGEKLVIFATRGGAGNQV